MGKVIDRVHSLDHRNNCATDSSRAFNPGDVVWIVEASPISEAFTPLREKTRPVLVQINLGNFTQILNLYDTSGKTCPLFARTLSVAEVVDKWFSTKMEIRVLPI